LRKKELRKRVNDVDIKILAYKILHPYQWDTDHAGCCSGAQSISQAQYLNTSIPKAGLVIRVDIAIPELRHAREHVEQSLLEG
jgi:hypothetical protein